VRSSDFHLSRISSAAVASQRELFGCWLRAGGVGFGDLGNRLWLSCGLRMTQSCFWERVDGSSIVKGEHGEDPEEKVAQEEPWGGRKIGSSVPSSLILRSNGCGRLVL
jgi:hypothetical protein